MGYILEAVGIPAPSNLPRNVRIPHKIAELLYSYDEDKQKTISLFKAYNDPSRKIGRTMQDEVPRDRISDRQDSTIGHSLTSNCATIVLSYK